MFRLSDSRGQRSLLRICSYCWGELSFKRLTNLFHHFEEVVVLPVDVADQVLRGTHLEDVGLLD